MLGVTYPRDACFLISQTKFLLLHVKQNKRHECFPGTYRYLYNASPGIITELLCISCGSICDTSGIAAETEQMTFTPGDLNNNYTGNSCNSHADMGQVLENLFSSLQFLAYEEIQH